MCGIAGILSLKKNSSLQQIETATAILQHRGPEEKNIWLNEERNVAFGHNRLGVIDLSEAASQPMHYMDRYTIIHNGEIYNYREIKKALEQKGYSFNSQSDTEVIVAAYHAFGEDCLQGFDGMFAFAIWDATEKKLFAARDRFGEKPFYFFYDKKTFAFASEMKGLWQMGISMEVNNAMLYNFLTIGYTSNPSEPSETFYKNLQNLPAASYLIYDLHKNEVQVKNYWKIYPEENKTITDKAAIEQIDTLLNESIKKRLRSDVAIGTSLSGGLDSSAIIAYCEKMTAEQYTHKCFTAVFDGFEKNEEQYAKIIAQKFNLQHFTVSIKQEEVTSLMKKLMWYHEIPIGSASALAQYKVYQTAKENGVTVLLDGQGADEIFGGYHKYYKWYWQELYRSKRLGKRNEIAAAKALGIKERFALQNKAAALFPEFAASMLQTRKAKLAFRNGNLNRDFAFANKRDLYYSTPTNFDLNGALYFNSFVYGLGELLHLADRSSAAHATEIRLPFLNHKLVEFLFTLPPNFKIRDGWTKWILRKTAEPLLPKDIVWRKDKIGFEVPQKLLMQNTGVQEAIQEGKKILVDKQILNATVLNKKIQPQDSYAAENMDWRIWSASFLF